MLPKSPARSFKNKYDSAEPHSPGSDRVAYTRLMLERSIESYLAHALEPGPTFFDRGIPYTLGYARLIGLTDDAFIQHACRRHRYAPVVFLAPPWEEIYKTDNERKQDFAEAQRTSKQLADVYREFGYEVIELPKTTPAARANFILQQLHLDRRTS